MRYLKRFNESSGEDLTFEEFKDIMNILLDNINSVPLFSDKSKSVPSFYDSKVVIPSVDANNENLLLSFDYLCNFIAEEDGIEVGETTDINPIKDGIDNQISTLKGNMNIILDAIKYNEDLKSYMELVEKDIIPRFERYDNFTGCGIGFNSSTNTLIITFEMSRQEDMEGY